MFSGVGSRRAAAVVLGVLSATAVVPLLVATMEGASATSTSTATLKAQQQHTTGSDYEHDCDQGPGWIFVLPASQGDAFVSLSATFSSAGTVAGTVLSNPKFASVQVSLSDTILSATAQITGGHEGSTFNITHVCDGGHGTTTSTMHHTTSTTMHHTTSTTMHATTTTMYATSTSTSTSTSTTMAPTSTSTSTSSTTFEVLGSTTVPSTASTSTTTVATEGSTVERSTTSTSVMPEGSTLASSSTTSPVKVVPSSKSLPFTGGDPYPLVWIALASVTGGVLLLGRHRARRV